MSLPTHRRSFLAPLLALAVAFTSINTALAQGLGALRAAINAQNNATPGLMRQSGVLGTAVTVDPGGVPTVVIYVDQNSPQAGRLAAALQRPGAGIPVQVELTEPFRAFVKPTGATSVSHTAKQTPPIQLGTSGGWRKDIANGYCCGGTLGSLVQVNGVQFILSNYHVLESDIVIGGNGIVAVTGDPVIQPGLIDVGCNANNSQSVATLQLTHSLPTYNVDVGLAQVVPGAVRSDGSILQIGTISSQTAAPSVGQRVKKSGRTSSLTRSSVAALNATITVTYDNECAGGAAFTKTFNGQIMINNKGSKFLKGGDSGSLMVEDVATNPRAVGLLYAGSNFYAIANPIDEVLTFVGNQLGGTATMVGN